MTEKQKMLAGELYHADEELIAEILRAQSLLLQFNGSRPDDFAGSLGILKSLLGHVGDQAYVRQTFRCDYGYNISIGDRTFVNFDCVFLDCNPITIGNEVQIAPGVHIYTATHPLETTARRSGLEFAEPVTIGDGVWLGGRVVVCPGVTIGENTVVGAGSVVTENLPANVLAVGAPARAIRAL
ncbi:sugar O-acetyltransferase [Rhizobium sp. P28RR-XV]|uniref:sugar O-acetyltransferase n=1 Tax=Rhizobium sp. P28RR-XV TaxID=2726737 RepID=UPI001980BC3F|nr:sugar O-acetyltransferase [Rhizobium sp. P28RR-XV]